MLPQRNLVHFSLRWESMPHGQLEGVSEIIGMTIEKHKVPLVLELQSDDIEFQKSKGR